MHRTRYEGLARRQAQWDAFHEWQRRREPEQISFEARIAWYVSAFDFSQRFLKPRPDADLETKAHYARHVRERLACMKCDDNV